MLKRKTLEVDWVVEETTTLVKKARRGKRYSVGSKICDGWMLFALVKDAENHVGIFLDRSVPTEADIDTPVNFVLKASPDHDEAITLATGESKGHIFGPDSSDFGFRSFLEESALKRIGRRKLRITCEITYGGGDAIAPTANSLDVFNRLEYSDAAVVAAGAKCAIFAQSAMLQRSQHFKTILDSSFSESQSTTRFPPSSPPPPDNRFLGDVNEFAAFGAQKASPNPRPEQDVAASQDDNAVDESAAHQNSTSPSGPSGAAELAPLREFRLIKVPDCSYATLAAYLAYLYSSKLDFLPSTAFFLAEEKEPGSSTESDFSGWADAKAKNGTCPSLPHAMYRLADCYMEPTTKARAKGWILQNITVETAPFELFSQLSLDYPEFQADVVDFVLANLDEVTATPGWKRAVALIDEGKVPGGGSILDKLLSKARKGTD